MKKIEVVIEDISDIEVLNGTEADRIILLSNLDQGGLTPSYEKVKKAKEMTNIPIRVMLRETSDSYVYDKDVMKKHLEDLENFKELGVEGIAFGALTEKGTVNYCWLNNIINNKGDLKLTFNKAIDEIESSKIEETLDRLKNMDVDVVMTSCADDEFLRLSKKMKRFIMPAAGIKIENAKEISNLYKADFLHVGSAVREDGVISVEKTNELKDSIK